MIFGFAYPPEQKSWHTNRLSWGFLQRGPSLPNINEAFGAVHHSINPLLVCKAWFESAAEVWVQSHGLLKLRLLTRFLAKGQSGGIVGRYGTLTSKQPGVLDRHHVSRSTLPHEARLVRPSERSQNSERSSRMGEALGRRRTVNYRALRNLASEYGIRQRRAFNPSWPISILP